MVKKDLNLHWINQGLLRKLKQNRQRNMIVKKDPYNYPVQMIKNLQSQNPKDTRIKIPKTTRDDKRCSGMSQSLDLGPIPRKKQKKSIRKFNHRE